MLVLASIPAIHLWAKERQEAFLLHKEHTCVNNEQEIARVKEAIRKDPRGRLVRERRFLVVTGMPRLLLEESCITSIKDFTIFPPHKNKARFNLGQFLLILILFKCYIMLSKKECHSISSNALHPKTKSFCI